MALGRNRCHHRRKKWHPRAGPAPSVGKAQDTAGGGCATWRLRRFCAPSAKPRGVCPGETKPIRGATVVQTKPIGRQRDPAVVQTKPMAGRGPPVAPNKPNQPWPAVQTKPISRRWEYKAAVLLAPCLLGAASGRNPKPVVRRLPRSARNDMFRRWAQIFKERAEGRSERQRPALGILPFYLLLLAVLWNLRKSA
jgi:hypothetical protein